MSPKTIGMINNLPRTTEFVFNRTPQNMRNNFDKPRRRLIRTLQKPNCEKSIRTLSDIGKQLRSITEPIT